MESMVLKMRKMKASGIEWIGEIPEGWEVHRMKSCISQRDGGAWGDEATGETGDCICLRIADFDYEHFRFTDSNNLTIRHYASPIIKKLLLQKNDILIEKSGGGEKTPVGRTVLFDKEYPALFANFMDRLRCSDFILPQYLQYVFVTFYKNRYTQNYIKQTTGIQNLDLSSMLADEFVPVPNLNEQKLIVCYLESKCSKIDNLLSKTRSSIEEYKKLKQAVITQAVTKGVRGKREMKDSGVEWIGEIPKEWVCEKIKYATSISRGLFNHRPRNDERYYNGKYPFIQTGDVANATKYIVSYSQTLNELGKAVSKEFPKGTLTMTIAANVGDVAILNFDAYFPDSVVGFIPNKNIRTLYLFYVFSAMKDEFTRTAIKSTQLNLNIDRVKETFIPVTLNVNEQCEIENYLESKCAEIDGLIAKKEQLVKELESYKKSLIYEVVTGKQEV
ncbi:restriction endonuclease subunit S [Faecalibacterium prausnitzii]|uniref:restriction endonuclease subunit S n=1 Tax=Faecalibacterium prausnitzii TaxID=853 RepID=UPI0012DD3AC8|nr:restriction endonuclease subunit S [Faecalibacterium prausnitzii]